MANKKKDSLSLYDMNKSLIKSMKPLSMSEISNSMGLLDNYLNKNMNNHHMLLCRDYNYYTIFESNKLLTFPTFSGAVCDIITNLGKVYSVEAADDELSGIEIWISPKDQPKECFAFYLFPYDIGVVHYG